MRLYDTEQFQVSNTYKTPKLTKKNLWSCFRLIEYDGSVWALFELQIKVSKYFQFCMYCDFF